MNFPFLKNKKTIRKSGFVYKQELIIRQGREQLKVLAKKGLMEKKSIAFVTQRI